MTAGEDQPHAAEDPHPVPSAPFRGAALAAEMLETACTLGSGDPLRLKVVRGLARDLKGELEALAILADGETDTRQTEWIEGALRAADVANLAACTVSELLGAHALEAAAAAYLASGAAQALGILVESRPEDARKDYASYALRDVRSAVWRARLATQQVDQFSGEAD